ncbi:hypothetical protein F5146DRAFT_1223008 [Armillaria mellea]|nr:hypothetical protein F5146DRAFT_1223008 [Armillaria mellea]
MTLEKNLRTAPATPPAADALSYLDAFIHSIPKPVSPPDEVYPLVTDILRATRPIIDTDNDWIPPNIALLEGQLSTYETLIDQLCTVVEELKGHRHAIETDYKRFSSILAPIRRLPADVLLSVFRETRSTRRNFAGRPPTIDFLQDPLTLRQVCGSWRDIVVSSPTLWSYINVVFPPREQHPDNSGPSAHKCLQTVLPLSGQHALDIRFVSFHTSDEATKTLVVILKERHRWRNASLILSSSLTEQLRVPTGRKLACLESLIIRTTGIRMPGDNAAPLEDTSDVSFIDAPYLRKVELNEPSGLGKFAFPRHITHLATVFTSVYNLQIYTQLEELHLHERDIDDSIALPHRMTFLNVLRLSISSLKPLRYLCLPSLEDLTFAPDHFGNDHGLSFDHPHVDAAATTFCDFIHSSRCSLISLATGTSIVCTSKFIQVVLPMLKSLTSLEFQIDRALEVAFYDALTSSSVLLPDLQHLTMRLPPLEMSVTSLPRDALSTMLASRRQRLRSVRFDCTDFDDEHVLNTEQVETLRHLGIETRVVDMGRLAGIGFGDFT